MDCETCLHSFMHGGICTETKNNCIHYKEDPRGKICRSQFTFNLSPDAETSVIKPREKITLEENGRKIELQVIRINWIDMGTMTCNVDAFYYTNEAPICERMKRFKVL